MAAGYSFVTDQDDTPTDGATRIAAIRGVIFQSDATNSIGEWFIRPLETVDRWVAGVYRPGHDSRLAMHVGIHVTLDDGREVVVEQIVDSFRTALQNGLSRTPIATFRARNHGGWDVTVPATSFRAVDAPTMVETLERLQTIDGRPFIGENCADFVERAFGERTLFADSPLLRRIGLGLAVEDPALPLLRPDAPADPRAAHLLRADALRRLPDARARRRRRNVRGWIYTALGAVALAAALGATARGFRR